MHCWLTWDQEKGASPSPPKKKKSIRQTVEDKTVNKLLKTHKLSPIKLEEAAMGSAKQCAVYEESDYRLASAYNYITDAALPQGNQTINPLSLVLRPDWQSGSPFGGYFQHNQMTHSSSKNDHFKPLKNQLASSRTQSLDELGNGLYRHDDAGLKLEGWNFQAQNPLAAHQGFGGISGVAYA